MTCNCNLRFTIRALMLIVSLWFFSFRYLDGQDNKFYLGFGGGINFAIPDPKEEVSLFENLSGEGDEGYSDLFQNLGYAYFFQVDYRIGKLVLSGTPGTYIYTFQRNTMIVNGTEPLEQSSEQLLHYFKVPVEVRFILFGEKVKPYLGGGISYGLLSKQTGDDHSIIPSKFTAGPLAGIYIDLNNITINANTGYNYGLHNITRKSDRYVNNGSGIYAQSDIALHDIFFNVSLLMSLEKAWRINSLQCKYP